MTLCNRLYVADSCINACRWLGDADFAKGLGAYFENTNMEILLVVTYGTLLAKHQVDVANYGFWLSNPGYPVLTIKVENMS